MNGKSFTDMYHMFKYSEVNKGYAKNKSEADKLNETSVTNKPSGFKFKIKQERKTPPQD